MDKVRVGIVGIGGIGTSHLKRIVGGEIEGMVLGAVCNKNPLKREHVRQIAPDTPFFSETEDMYKSGLIDAVIIATPHYLHPEQVISAFEHNLHVLNEKPAGVYAKSVRQINEAADKHPHLVYALMLNQRTNPMYLKVKQMVNGGETGTLRRIVWIASDWYRPQSYFNQVDWRATWAGEGGGVLINQAAHNIDLWQWIAGMPVSICAHCHNGKWHNIETEDDVTVYAEYANGATGVFITSTGDVPGTNRLEITCDNGKIVCEDNTLKFYKLHIPEPQFRNTLQDFKKKVDYEYIEHKFDGKTPQHYTVLQAFANKLTGKGEPVADGREGLNGVTLSNAIHLSSWLGKTVSLPVDEDLFYNELMKRTGAFA